MELYGKKVILCALEEEHIEMIRLLINEPEYEKMICGWSYPISTADQKRWYDNYQNSKNTREIRYTIKTKEDGPVGLIGLVNIDWKNGTADGGGMRIAKKEIRTKGLATDAWMTLLKYAFNELRLNRINGSAIAYNKASLRVCEKVGFKIEGIKRQAEYKNGKYHDVIMLGCLREDYENLTRENNYWEEENK